VRCSRVSDQALIQQYTSVLVGILVGTGEGGEVRRDGLHVGGKLPNRRIGYRVGSVVQRGANFREVAGTRRRAAVARASRGYRLLPAP